MKNLLCVVVSCLIGLSALSLSAAQHWIKGGVTDWTVADSYWSDVKPAAGDVVIVCKNSVNEIESGTASWDLMQKLLSINFEPGATIVVTVPEGVCATNVIPIGNSIKSPNGDIGTIIKRGKGKLVLNSPGSWVYDGICCAFLTKALRVEEGEVELPQGDCKYRFGDVFIAEGATFSLPRRAVDKFGECELATSYFGGISGAGTLSNTSPEGVPLVFDRPFTNEFTGTFDGGIRVEIADEAVSLGLTFAGGSYRVENGTGTLSLVKELPLVPGIGADASFDGDLTVVGGTVAVHSRCRYFKWVCMQCYGAEEVESGLSHYGIYPEEFGLFDADGKRVNIGLVKASSETVQQGEAAFVDARHENGYDYLYNGSEVGKFFNGLDDAENMMVMPRYSIVLSEPKSWVSLLMHLTNGTPAVASYDFASGAVNLHYRGYHPTRWKMLGSFDGANWTEIDNRYSERQALPADSKIGYYVNRWNRPDSEDGFISCTESVHNGYALALPWTSALANVRKLRVAAGAKLVADGEARLSAFLIDAADAGGFEGVSLADTGTLDIVNLARTAGATELPGFDGVSGDELLKLRNWTVTVNGKPCDAGCIFTENGKVYIRGKGIAVFLK